MEKTDQYSIDLYSLVKTLWSGRKTVIWVTTAFVVLGLVIAFTSPRVYTASTVMVPQVQSKTGGIGNLVGLGGLAAMAGINLNSLNTGNEDMSPLIYPEIVKSYEFQREIIHMPMNWSGIDKPVSMAEYGQKYQKGTFVGKIVKRIIGLPGTVVSWFRKENAVPAAIPGDALTRITKEEKELWEELSRSIVLSVDKKNGYVTLSASGPEPLVTAQIADKAQKLLQQKITDFRIEKAHQNVAFIEGRYKVKKEEFELAQDRLASYRDGNAGTITNRAKTEGDRLQSEYQLVFNVYSELAKQLESAKITEKEDTPVFSIIQSVIVPLTPTKPRKFMILSVCLVLGVVLGAASVFATKNWKESSSSL
jgi:LPS O-antigen subunit length determinant protein (WzzB/FepE family)